MLKKFNAARILLEQSRSPNLIFAVRYAPIQYRNQSNRRCQVCSSMLRAGRPSIYVQTYKNPGMRKSYQARTFAIDSKLSHAKKTHRAFIAFGSNVGNRVHYIEAACKALNAEDAIVMKRTSSLWETKAMYVLDQSDFLNGVCEVETTLEPTKLLDRLQHIENSLNRRKTVDKGPRTIDLDILLYDETIVESERLSIPHKLMLERAFVLEPLTELIAHERHLGDVKAQTYHDLLRRLPPSDLPSSTYVPLNASNWPLHALQSTRKTQIMSVLNITPDSFSDGGKLAPKDMSSIERLMKSQLSLGSIIFDVGGQSTRPNAESISKDEERSRVLPTIRHIRNHLTANPKLQAAISVDTYYSAVARAAVEAGADIINDVSAGCLDPDMLRTAAELGCTIVLMHMRGNPSNMTSKEHTSYPNGLVQTIGLELLARVKAAERAGVRRWRIILDPGIGFAKTGKQNLELLRDFAKLRDFPGLQGIPWLVGTSRKGFIGKITGVSEASERSWGTAAAITAAVQGGADIVRVHDVEEMSKVVLMADAIWRL